MKAIVNGRYVEVDRLPASTSNSQLKAWNLDDQRSVHARDILQPHRYGKPSGEYIRAYPEEAARQFTQQQIQENGNDYT